MSRSNPLPPGTVAPAFTLKVTPDQLVSLSDFEGQPVVLVFYPADFSPVCGAETAMFSEALPILHDLGAAVLGISVDSVWCHLAFAKQNNIAYPLLADFHPKGEVAGNYNVFRGEAGECDRALYVVDSDGKVAWSYVSPVGVNPGVDGVIAALEDLASKKTGDGVPM